MLGDIGWSGQAEDPKKTLKLVMHHAFLSTQIWDNIDVSVPVDANGARLWRHEVELFSNVGRRPSPAASGVSAENVTVRPG